jgi:thioredoxin 1
VLAPVLDSLAAQFAGRVRFAKVNVDQSPDLATRYELTGVPTLLLFRHGEIADEIAGLPSPRVLALRIEALLAPQPATPECSWCR